MGLDGGLDGSIVVHRFGERPKAVPCRRKAYCIFGFRV